MFLPYHTPAVSFSSKLSKTNASLLPLTHMSQLYAALQRSRFFCQSLSASIALAKRAELLSPKGQE